MTKLVANTVS